MRSKTDERRQRILKVASEAFQELGYEKCSMSEVAARVGGSKATLYNYFVSKEELFVAVMHQSAENLQDVFGELLAGGDFRAVLTTFARSYAGAILVEPIIATLRMAQHEAGRSEVGRVFYEAGPLLGTTVLATFLGQGMAQGALRQADPAVAARHLQVLLESENMLKRMLGAIGQPPAEVTDAAADRALAVFMAAYAARP